MRTRTTLLFLTLIAAALPLAEAYAQGGHARERVDQEEPASAKGVVIGLKGGVILSSPRRELPSLRVGETIDGTGEISSSSSEIGVGNRYGVELLFPFNEKLAFSTELGVETYVAKYMSDTTGLPVRLDVQILHLIAALEGNVYVDPAAFVGTGLRNVYISGGFDIGLKTMRNRVEGYNYPDSTSAPVRAVGSFENTEPFRNLVGLRFAGGVRYGFDTHWELGAEAAYTFALNPVFSSDVVRDNGFTVDNVGLQIGVGYRF